ncbi:MAG: MFS transporter [Syntrophomonadaceae bacterium]|nr:MFS transporter [Syntrophomonadaceae bacterium]
MDIFKLELKWRVFTIVAIGILISTLDGSILNIANPSIARELNLQIEDVQWVVTSYLLVITSSLIFFGRLGDKRGSNKVYTWGFLLFTLGSLGCSLSRTLAMLIALRMFQGIGASMMMATGIGIVANIFPAGERGKALGLTGTIVALGNMLGPSLGGLLLAKFQWPVIFLINIPIGLIGFFLGLRYLPDEHLDEEIKSYDIPGTLLLAAVVTMLMLGLSDSQSMNVLLLAAAGVLLLCFCRRERNTPYPLLDFGLFKNKAFVNGNLTAVAVYSTQTSVFFLLPFYMETILDFTPAYSGLMMTITPVVMAITAPLAGYFSDRFGSFRIISLALLLMTAAFLVLSIPNTNRTGIIIAGGLVLLGMGMGMFGSPNTSTILGAMPREKAGYGGGFISTNRNLSYSLGISLSVLLFTWLLHQKQAVLVYTAAYIESSRMVYWAAAAIVGAALILWMWAKSNRTLPK